MNDVKASDAVWIATALLQQSQQWGEFSVPEIVDRVVAEHLTNKPKQTVYLHANQHCVANRPPKNARLRMLIETPTGKRRLFHQGDTAHPLRANSRVLPKKNEVPEQYRNLLDWYEDWNATVAKPRGKFDRLLALAGTGKGLWGDEGADAYVRRLREDW